MSHARLTLRELRDEDPPLVWGDVAAGTGAELWWLLPAGLNELDPSRTADPAARAALRKLNARRRFGALI